MQHSLQMRSLETSSLSSFTVCCKKDQSSATDYLISLNGLYRLGTITHLTSSVFQNNSPDGIVEEPFNTINLSSSLADRYPILVLASGRVGVIGSPK